jgi:hypothetical protein
LLALVGLCACAYRPGHPVIRGPWGLGAPRASSAATVAGAADDDPAEREVATPARIDAFFGDLTHLRLRLREARAQATPLDQPLFRRSDRVAAEGLLRRLGGRGPLGGVVRNAVVYGLSARLPIAPRQASRLWLDPRAQGKALGVSAFHLEGRAFEIPEAARLAYRVEMLDVGTKPLTFDLVFGLWIEVLELGDGTVLLRYDPRPTPGARHVTLWRGGAILEPDGAGCVLTEVLAFGTDLYLPLLEPLLRSQIETPLEARAVNLCGFAYQVAGRPVPPLR